MNAIEPARPPDLPLQCQVGGARVGDYVVAMLPDDLARFGPAYLDVLLRRASRFAANYEGAPLTPEFIAQALPSMLSDRPKMVAFLALRRDSEELLDVGHSICSLEEWGGRTYATFLQIEIDPGVPRSARARLEQEGAPRFLAWAKANDVEGLQLFARSRTVARVSRTHGFEETFVQMRRPLADLEREVAKGRRDVA